MWQNLSSAAVVTWMKKNNFTVLHYKNCLSRHVSIHHMGWAKYQGFSFLSEVGARGLLNLGKKSISNNLNWTAISNGLKTEEISGVKLL